jgi:hypothetical protein
MMEYRRPVRGGYSNILTTVRIWGGWRLASGKRSISLKAGCGKLLHHLPRIAAGWEALSAYRLKKFTKDTTFGNKIDLARHMLILWLEIEDHISVDWSTRPSGDNRHVATIAP